MFQLAEREAQPVERQVWRASLSLFAELNILLASANCSRGEQFSIAAGKNRFSPGSEMRPNLNWPLLFGSVRFCCGVCAGAEPLSATILRPRASGALSILYDQLWVLIYSDDRTMLVKTFPRFGCC